MNNIKRFKVTFDNNGFQHFDLLKLDSVQTKKFNTI